MWFLLWKSENKGLSPTVIRLHFHFSDTALCKAKLVLMYFDCILYYRNNLIFPKQQVFTNCYCNKPSLRGNIPRKIQLKYVRNATKPHFPTFSQHIISYAYLKYYRSKIMVAFCAQHQKNQIFVLYSLNWYVELFFYDIFVECVKKNALYIT